MATLLNSRLLSNTYKDDFSDSDNYHRILFNSGRPLQARELTQMQTIIQEQIKRFGNNIFKEGAVVKPGAAVLNNSYEFAKLITTQYAVPSNYSTLLGNTFTGNVSGITARLIEVVPAGSGDPATIYIAYTNGPTGQTGLTTPRFIPGETITNGSTTLRVQETNTTVNPAVGRGIRYSIDAGIYYAKGFFVFTEAQNFIVSKYTDTANEIVGYKIVEDVINVDDDNDLYDNQGAVPNTSSPGADRLRIKLELTKKSSITVNDNFIPIASVKDGVVFRTVDEDNSYNVIGDVIATRIKENSGDYIVNHFRFTFEEDSDQDNLIMNVSPGTAVIDGYRANLYAPLKRRITKPTTTAEQNNEIVAADYGNYVLVDAGVLGNTKGIPNIQQFQKLNLRTATNYGGITIGTARIKAISEDTGNYYRYYLFDIQMNSGQNFRDTVSIGSSITDYFNLYRPLNKAELKDVGKNFSLFALPRRRPQALDDITLETQRRFQISTDGSGNGSITLTASGETFANTNDWIAAKLDSDLITNGLTFSSNPAGQVAANFTNLPASSTIEILAYVNKSVGAIRSKTLNEITITQTPDGNGDITLRNPDIFKVLRIRENDSDGLDLTSKYAIDNGQRDNYYGTGKLILKSGYTASSNPVFVRYKYFTHGANGDFFAINSYTGQVDYRDIPNHRIANGALVSLRDVLDFRSVKDSDGDYINSSTGARIHELPQVNDTIQTDVNYYLQQKAILSIDVEGNVILRRGAPGLNPTAPAVPPGNLPLYSVTLGANTLNDSDLTVEKIEHRRYTMKDIGKIEKRLDKLEEITALNMLEIDTKNLQVLDSAGNDRTKSGFFVDNFSTQVFSDLSDPNEYRAAIDPQLNFLGPKFNEDNIRLIYDSDASTNVIKKGDNIYLRHTQVEYISQTQASKSIVINPFEVVIYRGDIELSPASDEWREINVRSKKIVNGGSKLDTTQAYLWNNWQWNWGGKSIDELKVGSMTNTKTETTSTKVYAQANKVVSEETLLEVIDQRVLDVALIPFMRSRKIYFNAQGLRPSSKVYAYFAGKRVDNFVREETFTRMSDDHKEYGNTQNNATQHPEGSTELITDANGAVEGSFFLPNTSLIRFRTGVEEFKILDVSADNEKNSGTIARALYAAKGFIDTVDQTIKSTRVLKVEHTTSTRNRYNSGGTSTGGGGDGRHEQGPGNIQVGNTGHFTPTGGWPASVSSIPDPAYHEATNASASKDDGGKIICTALHQMNLLPYDIFAADQKYGKQLSKIQPDVVKGYHIWAQIVVDWMNGVKDAPNVAPWIKDDAKRIEYTRNWAIKWAQMIATPWALQMAYEMGVKKQGNKLGKLLMYVGYPISKFIGKSDKKPSIGGMIALFTLLRFVVFISGNHKYTFNDETVKEQY